VAALVLSAAARRALGGVWAYRARSEHEAVARFARLRGELAAALAPAEVVALAERAVDDEQRHVEICARMAAGYGERVELGHVAAAAPIGAAGLRGRDRLLYEVVAFCCVTESLNAALMTSALAHAEVPAVRAALRAILADEVGHSRLGWAYLAAERARGRGDFLAALLPRMLAASVAEELFTPAAPRQVDHALAAHGELSEQVRLGIFVDTMREVVFPGLTSLGVDAAAGAAWLEPGAAQERWAAQRSRR